MRIAKILSLTLLAAITAAILMWWILRPIPTIPVGMVAWMGSGAVVGSSEMHAADLFREEHPDSPIRVLPVDDEWDPRRTPVVIQEALDQGVRFFVSTHPSKCAVASMHLFADDRALMINMASTSPALTGRDDFLLRIIPDAVWEQQAIARLVDSLPGSRILVLQDETIVYEYAVLVTSLTHEILSVAQLYRDRADAENPFDELKNHWGWGGFTTRDLKRCRFMARITALTDNWWSLFVRLADPSQQTEAITSRPLLLTAPARLTRHSGQTRLTISHPHAEAAWVEAACRKIADFFSTLRRTAEQLTPLQCWYRLLSRALVKDLHGRQLQPPAALPAPA